eukprot:13367914-Alexandrium_andersonii.AAC.1
MGTNVFCNFLRQPGWVPPADPPLLPREDLPPLTTPIPPTGASGAGAANWGGGCGGGANGQSQGSNG